MKRIFQHPASSLVFKVGILILLLGLLYFELTSKNSLPKIWDVFLEKMSGANFGWFLIALLLMPVNWLAETKKWHSFLRRYEPMSLWKAQRAVFAGVAVSLFTPNRIGEYGGRILFVSPANYWKAIIINLVGNFAQFVVLLTFGIIGAVRILSEFWSIKPVYVNLLTVMAASGLAILYLMYFNIKGIIPIARRFPILHHIKRFAKDIRVLEHFSRLELSEILLWASLRYTIYVTQYYCLLHFFEIKTTLLNGYAGIAAIFLLQTSIPLPPVMGLVARGNLAIQVWSQMGANEVSSLAVTFTLWIINLILPALVGTFSLFYVNIAKTFGHENENEIRL